MSNCKAGAWRSTRSVCYKKILRRQPQYFCLAHKPNDKIQQSPIEIVDWIRPRTLWQHRGEGCAGIWFIEAVIHAGTIPDDVEAVTEHVLHERIGVVAIVLVDVIVREGVLRVRAHID